ncbi:apolipoprotein N-acyltransferase [Marinobacterium jannaschii]|uniref:apolipoprotein N-acyltransferase n=1 Tax=Marinobacterium jannaschii TaxID=64970 RepID=UPI000568A40B|nr:apolipoprotein N-acyltransferase [Marinobacterium jannaschii]
MLALIAAALAGMLVTPALAPFNYVWLAPLAPAVLFLLLRNASPRQAWWRSWAFGSGLFGAGTSWIYVSMVEHSATPQVLAIGMTALFVIAMGLFVALPGWIWRRWLAGRFAALSFIGLWFMTEWLRSWVFTGFPWLYLGYATLDTPLAAWLPIGGVWLGSLIMALAGVAIAKLLVGRNLSQRLAPALLLVITTLATFYLPTQWTRAEGEPIRVALVQADIAQEIKWKRTRLEEILQRYMDLSGEAGNAELLIWPETAIPTFYSIALPQLGPYLDQLEEQQRTLISGIPTARLDPDDGNDYLYHNSIAVLSGGLGVYHKQRLVPFGEYVPMESQLRGLIDFFNLPMSSFSLPQGEQELLNFHGRRIAASVCYEIAYPELIRESAVRANLLLTVSNDTWFGNSIAPDQHMQIARVRALENGRWLIRATNNGISGLVNPQGDIVAVAERFQQAVLSGEVQSMQGATPYQRWGQLPALLLALLLLLAGGVPRRQSRLYR